MLSLACKKLGYLGDTNISRRGMGGGIFCICFEFYNLNNSVTKTTLSQIISESLNVSVLVKVDAIISNVSVCFGL